MLIYATSESISTRFRGVVTQHHSKSLRKEKMNNSMTIFVEGDALCMG
jgi:uncharacterized protein (DUF1786 family)